MRTWVLAAFIVLGVTVSALQAQAPPEPNPKDVTAHIMGYAHLDMTWLWRWEETIPEFIYDRVQQELDLMDRYPDFTYVQDQALVYNVIEHDYPDAFKRIQYRVKTHNWIPASSTWTQGDENMPDGESLVRQFLYGQKYSQEKFGHYIRVAWQSDVFGHPYSMPQIARKAGIDFFLAERPHKPKLPPIYYWKGLDGSTLLSYDPPGDDGGRVIDHSVTLRALEAAQTAGVKDVLLLYSPNATAIEGIAKLSNSPQDVHVKPDNFEDYLDVLLPEKKDFPVVEGEQNRVFEGCYTSQVDMKRHNRMAEQLLITAEKMSEIATLNRYRRYPGLDLTEAWKLALLNETHDLLPGSSIGPVYADATQQYKEIFERGRRALDNSLQCIGSQLDTQGEGVPLVVYNPHSWDRTDLVTTQISAFTLPQRMVATHGAETVPVQVLKRATLEGDRESATIAFVAQKVPQMGLKLYRIVAAPESAPAPVATLEAGTKPRPYLENEFLRVECDPNTGNIIRLFDKRANREALRGDGNFLVALEDTDEESRKSANEYAGSAWNVGLTGKKWDVDKASSVTVSEHGPVRATLRVVHRFRDSQFVQEISLLPGVPRVDVQMSLDWHERNTLLKVGFPVRVAAPKVAAEIPYGAIERDQTGEEMVMGKWVDLSDANYGVAILNNGRDGFDARDNVLRISLIRGASFPDPRADEGQHRVGYSIYPHRGGWREGKVEFQAMAFNESLWAVQEPAHRSSREILEPGNRNGLPDSYSFVKTVSDNVILSAMKQKENSVDAILRFNECEGRAGDVSIELPFKVRAVETNLLEDTTGPIGEGRTITFHMKPWEIKSIRLTPVR